MYPKSIFSLNINNHAGIRRPHPLVPPPPPPSHRVILTVRSRPASSCDSFLHSLHEPYFRYPSASSGNATLPPTRHARCSRDAVHYSQTHNAGRLVVRVVPTRRLGNTLFAMWTLGPGRVWDVAHPCLPTSPTTDERCQRNKVYSCVPVPRNVSYPQPNVKDKEIQEFPSNAIAHAAFLHAVAYTQINIHTSYFPTKFEDQALDKRWKRTGVNGVRGCAPLPPPSFVTPRPLQNKVKLDTLFVPTVFHCLALGIEYSTLL